MTEKLVKLMKAPLNDDEQAVSPVIGVILMVAITVILAAVIATFVLGLGEQVSETAPQASFSFDYEEGASAGPTCDGTDGNNDGQLQITHDGGATLDAQQLNITGSSESGENVALTDCGYSSGDDITAGDDVLIDVSSNNTIRMVWANEQGTTSATLSRWQGPDA